MADYKRVLQQGSTPTSPAPTIGQMVSDGYYKVASKITGKTPDELRKGDNQTPEDIKTKIIKKALGDDAPAAGASETNYQNVPGLKGGSFKNGGLVTGKGSTPIPWGGSGKSSKR